MKDKRPLSLNTADIMALNLQLKEKIETLSINTAFPTNTLLCCHSLNPLVMYTNRRTKNKI